MRAHPHRRGALSQHSSALATVADSAYSMYKVCGSFAVALLVLFAISTVVIMLRPTPKLTAPAFRSR